MRLLFIFLFVITATKAFSADSSNVLSVDFTFFIQLGLFIFTILFLKKFLFQPLLNLKDDRDIETFVKIERAKNIEEQSGELDSEYKKRIVDFKSEMEKLSNEKISEAKKQAEKIIKEAEADSIASIKQARENLNSELIDSIKLMTIEDIKIKNDNVSMKIKELSRVIRSKIN